jgi:hypothetical protein
MPADNQEKSACPRPLTDYSTMYWTIEHAKDRHFVRVVAGGIYNIDDHMRMLKDVATRDFWTPGMNLLIDDSNLDFSQTSLEQLREAGRKRIELNALIGSSKTAVLGGSLADFARARQFELITNGKVSAKIDIFNNEDKAISGFIEDLF